MSTKKLPLFASQKYRLLKTPPRNMKPLYLIIRKEKLLTALDGGLQGGLVLALNSGKALAAGRLLALIVVCRVAVHAGQHLVTDVLLR